MNLTVSEKHFIYHWFHNMLSKELSLTQLQVLYDGTFEPFFTFMESLGFKQRVDYFRQQINAYMLSETPELELAAMYAEVFLLDGKTSVLPYASAYLDDQQLIAHLENMDGYLKQYKLGINKEINEPSDHLCIYLEIMLKLLENNQMQEYDKFLRSQLFSWFPAFLNRISNTELNIYTNLLLWLGDVLKQEITN